MNLLTVENLVVNYGYIHALLGIDFHVEEGEIITLIGSNGAGKTTSLMSISGLLKKADGKITFMGQDISSMKPHNIARLGISHVPEGRKIFPELSVDENLKVGTIANPRFEKQKSLEVRDRVYKLFPRLKERLNQGGGTLSGGEQQMLAIGRGLMMEPKLLILDEPSLGLAPNIVENIFELITQIRDDGITILLVEQNASMALAVADRGYVLENGKIILEGSGESLLVNEEVRRAYLGA
jgi:branched-chain amino acid transport system ATP-binding protein